jgi:hypothetical protein
LAKRYFERFGQPIPPHVFRDSALLNQPPMPELLARIDQALQEGRPVPEWGPPPADTLERALYDAAAKAGPVLPEGELTKSRGLPRNGGSGWPPEEQGNE